jgi:hypothetical protein
VETDVKDETNQTIVEIKRKLQATPGIDADLKPIVKAGLDRDSLLDLLVQAVMPTPALSVTDRIRKKQQELRSVAMQVTTVARHAERMANDPSSYIEFFSPFRTAEFKRHRDEGTKRRAARWPFKEMRDYANWAENEARNFGELLRRNAPAEHRVGIFFVLSQVYLKTGEIHAVRLARLLTDASHATGKNEMFSAGRLTKMFERHVFSPPQKKRKKR